MRNRTNLWVIWGAVVLAGSAMSYGCVVEDDEGSPATHAGGASTTGGTTSTGGIEAGGAAGQVTVVGGEGGAAVGTGGVIEAGAGGAVLAGAGGAAGAAAGSGGEAGAPPACIGDSWSAQPDCTTLPGGFTDCGGGDFPLGVANCLAFSVSAREGFVEAFHACVNAIPITPPDDECSAAYEEAVQDCSSIISATMCETEDAVTYCGTVECSEITNEQCLDLFNTYPPAVQGSLILCYDADEARADTTGCWDALVDCEAGL